MLELRILNAGQSLPLFDLPKHLGRREAARELSDTIEGLIALVDELGGDPDFEDGGDDELTGDEADMPWSEWHTRGAHKLSGGAEARLSRPDGKAVHEDDEDDDPAEDDDSDRCAAGEDMIAGGAVFDYFFGHVGTRIGDDVDGEWDEAPAYRMNQTLPLRLEASND